MKLVEYVRKQILKKILSNKGYMAILLLLVFLTSFMYYFVEFSIDGNDRAMKEYIVSQKREDFRFQINVLYDSGKIDEVISEHKISQDDVAKFGKEDAIKRNHLDLSEYEPEIIKKLQQDYNFISEKRVIKNVNSDKKNYFIINKPREINIPYIVEGNLPQEDNEIALFEQFIRLNNMNLGDEISIDNKKFTITGSFYLPDYQAFIPFNSLEQNYNDASFAIVSENAFKQIQGKEEVYYSGKFLSRETNNEKIKDLRELAQFSYLENAENISSDSLFQMGLDSNKVLALTFLVLLLSILLFVFYMFFKRFTLMNQQEFGCIRALGYGKKQITKVIVEFVFVISVCGSMLAIPAAYFASSVLVNKHAATYGFPYFQRNINLNSFFMGSVLVILAVMLITYYSIMIFLRRSTCELLNNIDNSKEHFIVKLLINKIADKLPERTRLSSRVAFRKINALFLAAVTILIVSTLFITSFSLYMSSGTSIENQTLGSNYKYDVSFDFYQIYDDGFDEPADYYLKKPISIVLDADKVLDTQILGIKIVGKLFTLFDAKKNPIDIEKIDGLIINQSISKLYNISIGDEITYFIDKKEYRDVVSEICINGDVGNVYVNKIKLTNQLGISPNVYSGMLTDNYIETEHSQVISYSDKSKIIMENSVSNQVSAVINQVVGIIIGCLLLYLIILLNFEDSTRDILILSTLGYIPKKINKLLIDVYKPIFCLFYIVLIPVAIYISLQIHNSISIQTNDYIPFSTNIGVVLIAFVIIMLIYNIVLFVFKQNIKKLVKKQSILSLRNA